MKEAEQGHQSAPKVKCPKCDFPNPAEQPACSRCRTPLPRVKMQADDSGSADDGREVLFRRGQIIANRYTVIDLIGRGGMGCIYRVRDNTLNEDVALKTLLPQFVRDKVVVERFYNEARIARQLSHINIVRVHDIGFAGNILYISMECLRGKSLRSMLDEVPTGTRLPLRLTLNLIDQLCEALEYAHKYTIHRDIKPENVMLCTDGTVKLMDFGISKLMTHTQLTAASMVMGTPYYMSPEQLKDSSAVDARADIYSVGVMLYEMLTGNLPTGVIKPASQILRELPPELDPIVARCVEPDPKNRFASAAELREALRPIRTLIESDSNAPVPAAAPRTKSGSGLVLKAVGFLLILAILGLAGWGIFALDHRRKALLAAEPAPESAQPANAGAAAEPASELDALLGLLPKAQDQAKNAAGDDKRLQTIVNLGMGYQKTAESLASSNPQTAADQARRALQCFLGVYRAPEGMVFVPPGKVEIGEFTANLDGFFIDARETTNAEYAKFVNGAPWRPAANGQNPALARPELPVTMVALYDAMAYAAWRGKQIPTEAQWVLATYSLEGKALKYPWDLTEKAKPSANEAEAGSDQGDEVDPKTTDEPPKPLTNTADPTGKPSSLMAPGSLPTDQTPTGCLDMMGNVSEWTRTPDGLDTARVDLDLAATEALPLNKDFVLRGASYVSPALPGYYRFTAQFQVKYPHIGFRCVQEIPKDIATLKKRV